MYSSEIQEYLNERNYSLSSEEYIKVIDNPQIQKIKYNPYDNTMYIKTNDGYYWTIRINYSI